MSLSLPTGHILRMRPNGARTLYGENATTDSQRGNALLDVLENELEEGDALLIGPGRFSISTQWPRVDGVSLIGSGYHLTELFTDFDDGLSAAPGFLPGSGCHYEGIWFHSDMTVEGAKAFGLRGSSTSPAENIRCYRCRFTGPWDAVYFSTQDPDINISVRTEGCLVESQYDPYTVQWNSSSFESINDEVVIIQPELSGVVATRPFFIQRGVEGTIRGTRIIMADWGIGTERGIFATLDCEIDVCGGTRFELDDDLTHIRAENNSIVRVHPDVDYDPSETSTASGGQVIQVWPHGFDPT
jgi:hypothetical protein